MDAQAIDLDIEARVWHVRLINADYDGAARIVRVGRRVCVEQVDLQACVEEHSVSLLGFQSLKSHEFVLAAAELRVGDLVLDRARHAYNRSLESDALVAAVVNIVRPCLGRENLACVISDQVNHVPLVAITGDVCSQRSSATFVEGDLKTVSALVEHDIEPIRGLQV